MRQRIEITPPLSKFKFIVIQLHGLLRKHFQVYLSSPSKLANSDLETESLKELKKQPRPQQTESRSQSSSVVEGFLHKVSLKMMPMAWRPVFPSVQECQVQKPCTHDELGFISFTECLYSGLEHKVFSPQSSTVFVVSQGCSLCLV